MISCSFQGDKLKCRGHECKHPERPYISRFSKNESAKLCEVLRRYGKCPIDGENRREMNSKKKLQFISDFGCCNVEEMDKIIKILGRTRETKRIDDEIAHFDSVRLEGKAKIEDIVCHAIAHDDLGKYEEFRIRLRFKEDHADEQE